MIRVPPRIKQQTDQEQQHILRPRAADKRCQQTGFRAALPTERALKKIPYHTLCRVLCGTLHQRFTRIYRFWFVYTAGIVNFHCEAPFPSSPSFVNPMRP